VTIVFLGLYGLAAVLHLAAILAEKGRLQGISKICLLPLLLGLYVVTARTFQVPVVFALLFGWAGDCFLIAINRKGFFQLGLGSFLLGHLCYILALGSFAGPLHRPTLIIAALIALALGIAVFAFIKPDRTFRIPVIVYEIVIEVMSIYALRLLVYRQDGPGIAVFVGSLCFLFSDVILAFFTFRRMPRYGNFLVMVPYMAAQLAIILGLTLC
jgi:uncharacterized membrane protein YhhN